MVSKCLRGSHNHDRLTAAAAAAAENKVDESETFNIITVPGPSIVWLSKQLISA